MSTNHGQRFRASRAFLPYHFGLFALIFATLSAISFLPLLGLAVPVPERGVLAGCFQGLSAIAFMALGALAGVIAALQARAAVLSYRLQGWAFCRRMAWMACLFFPFGTILGLWIAYWMGRPEVRQQFAAARAMVPPVSVR